MKVPSVIFLSLLLFFAEERTLDDLPLNKIQVLGSHNSYKQAIDPPLFDILKQKDSIGAKSIEYSHISLSDQLSSGLRNLEIDFYADTKGGKYASPKGLSWIDKGMQKQFDPEGVMNESGFKVLHMQDIDFRSSCLRLKDCLEELRIWSDHHNGHYPVFITLNAKDDLGDFPGFEVPEKFTSEIFDQLDRLIIETLGKDKVITPDVIRDKAQTLELGVLKGQWPKMVESKNKFIFILDEVGEKQATYIEGHPSLKNRVLFVNAEPGKPEAAFLIINDPQRDSSKILQMVRKGYIVRTRADADTQEARRNDKTRFKIACNSGAQIITTDYYIKSTHFKSDYSICFDDGKYVRRNPVIH